MWGRVLPNDLGLPTYIQFNKVAAGFMTDAYLAEPAENEDGERVLRLSRAPAGEPGVRLTKKGRLNLGGLLDEFNRTAPLTDQPFPVLRKRLRGGEVNIFELRLLSPDPELRASGAVRPDARPMRLEAVAVSPGVMSADQFVRLFALAELIEGTFTEQDVQARKRELLSSLPTHDEVLSRFGSWERFTEFLAFQVTKLQRRHLGLDDLKNLLYEALEGQP